MRIRMSPLFWGLIIIFILVSQVDRVHAGEKRYERTIIKYDVPEVTLINQDRERIKLVEILNSDKPVMLDFIYGTCTTICPVLSAGFSNMQRKLGPDSDQVRMISISIDPEHDTPEVMKEYLARYRAKPGWDFLTGSREDVDKVMHAFDAYVQDKMSHYPLTLLHAPHSKEWIRIYGLIGTAELMAEFQKISGK